MFHNLQPTQSPVRKKSKSPIVFDLKGEFSDEDVVAQTKSTERSNHFGWSRGESEETLKFRERACKLSANNQRNDSRRRPAERDVRDFFRKAAVYQREEQQDFRQINRRQADDSSKRFNKERTSYKGVKTDSRERFAKERNAYSRVTRDNRAIERTERERSKERIYQRGT